MPYQVWEGSEFWGLLIRKWLQPALIHRVIWLSYRIYAKLQKQHLKVEIYRVLGALPAPKGSVSSAEPRPDLRFQSFDRSLEAEQYKCLKGSLDSIPFHLFSLTQNLQTVFCVSQRGLDLCGASSSTAVLLTWQWIHFLQLTLSLCSHFVAQWALK